MGRSWLRRRRLPRWGEWLPLYIRWRGDEDEEEDSVESFLEQPRLWGVFPQGIFRSQDLQGGAVGE